MRSRSMVWICASVRPMRLADRLHEGFDRGLALLERGGGVLLVAVEPLARELQEHLVVALQARAGELAERRLQLLAHPRDGAVALAPPRSLRT